VSQTKNNYLLISLVLFFFSLISGCAEMDSHSQISRFQNSEDIYRASMRWGEWTNLFQLMKDKPDATTKLEQASEDYLTHLESISIEDAEVLSSGMNKAEETGQTKLKIGYRFDNSAKVHSIKHTIAWWYHEESNTWFTDTALPEEFDLPESRTIKLSPDK